MILLSAQHIQKSFGGNTVLRDASLVLQDGQRLGLVGVNGSGKSTLMKIIAGLEPYDGGALSMQKGLRLGYLAQQGMVTPGKTVLEELEAVFAPVVAMEAQLRETEQQMAHAAEDPERLRQLGNQYDQLTRQFEESNGYGWRSTVQGVLAGLGFRKEQQGQLAESLSGGERTRLCLGRLLLQRPDVLLLDEPTNHLDMDSREVLEAALEDYPGTILAISHDRYFINRFATRVMVLEQGGVKEYLGNYDDYLEKINRGQAPDGDQPQTTKTAQDKEKRRSREATQRLKALKAAVSEAEAAVAKAEQEQADLEALMAAPETYQDAAKAAELAKRYQQVQQEVARRYEVWEAAEVALAAEE